MVRLAELGQRLSAWRKPGPDRPRPEQTITWIEPLEDRTLLSLLGVSGYFNQPVVQYGNPGTLAYTAADHMFNASSTPLVMVLNSVSGGDIIINPTGNVRELSLSIQLDNAGGVVSGAAGDDLVVTGRVSINDDGNLATPDIVFDGVLLTGEISLTAGQGFGWFNLDPNPGQTTSTDQFDFRFSVTGGLLAPYFAGRDLGVYMLAANSTFQDDFTVDFTARSQGTLAAIPRLEAPANSSIAGRVYVDQNGSGSDDGEPGIGSVTVTLTGTDVDGVTVNLVTQTLADGSYLFDNLKPSDASGYTITQTQPVDYLDGQETVGSLGGSAAVNDVISGVVVGPNEDGVGYNFGELTIPTAMISGFVWEDFNNDGLINFDEYAIQGVTVRLTGVDVFGQAVDLTTTTDADGYYQFTGLRAGQYTLTETQPADYLDGKDALGTVDGEETGVPFNDVFASVTLDDGSVGENYDFGERPDGDSPLGRGMTATIGYWQNKNGQNLLKSLNGGQNSTQLSQWLVSTFPNMFGAGSIYDMTGLTNDEVAALYKTAFKAKKSLSGGNTKIDPQFMGVAFAVYVTNTTLAGTVAEAYGFKVSQYGTGAALVNVGSAGNELFGDFGVQDGDYMSVMDVLLYSDAQAVNGVLFNGDSFLRSLANDLYTSINEDGDI